MNKQNLALGLALVALVLAIIGLAKPAPAVPPLGQIADVSLFDRFQSGTTTASNVGEFVTYQKSATSTLNLDTDSVGGRAGCINLRATNGSQIRIYATTTPGNSGSVSNATGNISSRGLVIEEGSCK